MEDHDTMDLVHIRLVPAGFLVSVWDVSEGPSVKYPLIQLLRNIIADLEGESVTQSEVTDEQGNPVGTLVNMTNRRLN